MNTSNFIALIPCYNCERTIVDVIRLTKRYCSDVIVIDDGSNDNSVKIATQSKAKILSLEKNLGNGNAIQEGIKVASKIGFKYLITLDADGAHLPSDIPKLIKAQSRFNYDLTIGNRWLPSTLKSLPSSKYVANIFARYILNLILKTELDDVACGFRVFSPKAAKLVGSEVTSKDFGFIYETIHVLIKNGLKVGNTAINVNYDANKLFATGINELISFLKISIKLSRQKKIADKIKKILARVSKFEPLYISLKNSHIYIIAHPVKEYSSYIFQMQNSFFSTNLTAIEI